MFRPAHHQPVIIIQNYIIKHNKSEISYLYIKPSRAEIDKLDKEFLIQIIDILYNKLGNVTLLWSSNLENIIKDTRIKK